MQYRSAIASPSTTDPIGTVGVDMAANPLALGYRTLRNSVNLRHEQGRLMTRPGFNYQGTGTDGQFQGAFHYAPSKGLSARPFAPEHTVLTFVIAGKLYASETTQGMVACAARPLCGPHDFNCRGPVDIFQAENWLVVQNERSNTFFWEGAGCLLESAGLGEDLEDTDPTPGKAPPPSRGRCWTTGTYVHVTVVDDATGKIIEGATVRFKVGNRVDYTAPTDAYGEALFYPVPKTYTLEGIKAGYDTATRTVVVTANDTKFITLRLVLDGVQEYPAVLMLVLDQTGSIGVGGALRGLQIIDETDVQAMGYVSFGDGVVQSRPVTTNLATVRAELVYAVGNPTSPPFFGDYGGDIPENGVDAIAEGLALLAAFTGLPTGDRALFFKTDTAGHKYEASDPAVVNTQLNTLDAVWLEFGTDTDGGESGLYATTFPETAVVSHSSFPLPI